MRMIPLAVPNLVGNEARYLQECIETTFVSSVGPFVSRFEEMVAAAAGNRSAVATSAGTTGLHAALVAVGVQRNDLVILQSMTFIASANAISHCGASPWLVDIDTDSWTLDPEALRRLLQGETARRNRILIHRSSGRRIAAIMPVYTLGMPARMDELVAVAREFEVPIVADAAAALGATYKGRPVGDLGADLSVFSFNGNKTVTAGGGGIVAGNDESLVQRVRHLTTTARCGMEYDHDMVGFNYRMTNLQAAVGCAQMEQLERFVETKRRIARRYSDAFRGYPVGEFPSPAHASGACWFAGVTVSEPKVPDIIPMLRAREVDARPFWKPIHLQVPYARVPRTPLPISDALWPTILTLPCSTGLTDDQQEAVITAVKTCIR